MPFHRVSDRFFCLFSVFLISLISLVTSVSVTASVRPVDRISMPTETISIKRVGGDIAIKLDGKLDESIWSGLDKLGYFETVEPDTLEPGLHPTEMYMFYNDKGIYIGFDMHQPKDSLVARLSSRDQRQLNRDAVFVSFDSSSESRYGYWFGIALGGSLMDGTLLPERRYNSNWDGPWSGATAETDHGWSAEMYIPWAAMSMPQRESFRNIGIYVSRKVAYLDQRWAWPGLPSSKPQFISVFDQLRFDDIAPKQQLRFFPYASGTFDRITDDSDYKAGFDIFWRPSTNTQVSATLAPDFGSVEADDVIVNLSGFETFFPEKRLFFLEGQEVFIATPRASRGGRPTTLLHTRRIGGPPITPDTTIDVDYNDNELYQPTELLGAMKATGQNGALRYGFLAAAEDEIDLAGIDEVTGLPVVINQQGKDFAVGRLLLEGTEAGSTRGLGWMSTVMNHEQREAQVHAVDAHYLSADGQWQWDGQAMYSNISGIGSEDEGEGAGGFFDVVYSPNSNEKHELGLEYFDDKLDISDVGFLRRNDTIKGEYGYSYNTSDISFGRNASAEARVLGEWNTDRYATRQGIFIDADVTFNNLTSTWLVLNIFPERYEDRNSFGNGTYRIQDRQQIGLGYRTDTSNRLSGRIFSSWRGEEMGGYFVNSSVSMTYRPVDRLTTEFSVEYQNRNGWLLWQSGKNMTTFDAERWTYRWDLDFFFTAHQQFRASLQWVGIRAFEDEFWLIPNTPGDLIATTKAPGAASDSFTISNLNLQIRYRWEIAPMSDLFVVYTKNGGQDIYPTDDFSSMFQDTFDNPSAEQLVVKLRYRFGS